MHNNTVVITRINAASMRVKEFSRGNMLYETESRLIGSWNI